MDTIKKYKICNGEKELNISSKAITFSITNALTEKDENSFSFDLIEEDYTEQDYLQLASICDFLKQSKENKVTIKIFSQLNNDFVLLLKEIEPTRVEFKPIFLDSENLAYFTKIYY